MPERRNSKFAPKTRRQDAGNFARVLTNYRHQARLHALEGFKTLGIGKPTWSPVIASNWPPEWSNVVYQFYVYDKRDHIGVAIFVKGDLHYNEQIVSTVKSFEPELEQLFPGCVMWGESPRDHPPFYGDGALSILFKRDARPSIVAEAMCTLIEQTHIRLEATLQKELSAKMRPDSVP